MSGKGSNKGTRFWKFIKDCMQERVEQIGTEGLKDKKYWELDDEIMALDLRLGEALPKDKRGLVDEYHNLMAEEEVVEEEAFYWQGFVDAARMLWNLTGEKEVRVEFRL